MREARARESWEEGETRRRVNAYAMREARARESREEGETRRRANADAMREARARRIADRGWSHVCPLAFRKYCCSRPNLHTKVVEASEATCTVYIKLGECIRHCGASVSELWFVRRPRSCMHRYYSLVPCITSMVHASKLSSACLCEQGRRLIWIM